MSLASSASGITTSGIVTQTLEHLTRDRGIATPISSSTRLQEDLGLDSLDMVEMIMTIEDRFGIKMPDGDGEVMKTVGDVVLKADIALSSKA